MAFGRAQFANFTRELGVATRGLTGTEASKRLATAARRHIAEVQGAQSRRSGGIVPDHNTIVDGRPGAVPEQVRPDGVILIQWHYLTEAVIRTVDYLLDNGPERSGEWKSGITTYVDDVAIPRDAALPKGAREAIVAARVPYARRLEIGTREDGKPFVLQVEQHFVQQAAIALRPVLRPLGWEPRFTYVQLAANTRGLVGRARNRAMAEMRFPAIAIRRARSAAL